MSGKLFRIGLNMNTRKLAFFGMMLAIVTVLSFIENTMPPLPFMPPGIRLGLSNIVTMYCLFFIGKKDAFALQVFKSVFVFITRGPAAGAISLSGGILSLLVMITLLIIFKKRISYLILSVFGAVFHNVGQITAASFMLSYNLVFWYMPVSIAAGTLMGSVTGYLLKVTLPLFDRISP
jgi:heptaprenyl diphosphate synthase